jgi:hypothetical protein
MRLKLRFVCHAASGCGNDGQTLEINRLGAIDARAVTSVAQSNQRCPHITKLIVISLHLALLQRRALPFARLVFQIVDVRGSYAGRSCCCHIDFPRRAAPISESNSPSCPSSQTRGGCKVCSLAKAYSFSEEENSSASIALRLAA